MTETQTVADPKEAAIKELIGRFNEEASKRWDEREPELLERLEKEINDRVEKRIEEIQRANPRYSLPGSEPTGNPAKDFSYARALSAIRTGRLDQDAPLEAEMFREMQKVRQKAQSFGAGDAGGYIVPEQQAESVIDRLKARSIAFALGVRDMGGLDRAPIIFPRKVSSTTAAWGAEAAPITESSVTLEQISLSPKELTALNTYSNTLLMISHPSIESVIREDIADEMALALDLGVLIGGGVSAPVGVANQPGISTSTVNTAPVYDELQDVVGKLRTENALNGSLGWAMSATMFNAIAKIKDASGGLQALERRVLADGPVSMLLGYPYQTSTQLPSTGTNSVIFGNWAECFVGRWGTLELMASPHTKFTTNQTQIRAILYADVGVRHPKSFCAAL